MSERTIMIFSKNNTCFVGKLDSVSNVINGLCMCSFIMAQTNQGPIQLIGLRKLGSLKKILPDDVVVDLETDSDVYADYVRITTGVQIETAKSMPKQPIRH